MYRKSSYSVNNGACVEAGDFRKSSYSIYNGDPGSECVEVAGGVRIRDSKQEGRGPVLEFGPAAWQAFTAGLKVAPASAV